MILLRDELIAEDEKRETWPKTCNETLWNNYGFLYLIFRHLKLAVIALKGGATLKQCVAEMNAHGWMYFVVLVVLFVSSNGKIASNPNIIPNSQGQTLIVKGNSNAVSLDHDKKIETALTEIKEKLDSLDKKITSLLSSSGSRSKLLRDFSLSLFFFSISQSTTYLIHISVKLTNSIFYLYYAAHLFLLLSMFNCYCCRCWWFYRYCCCYCYCHSYCCATAVSVTVTVRVTVT